MGVVFVTFITEHMSQLWFIFIVLNTYTVAPQVSLFRDYSESVLQFLLHWSFQSSTGSTRTVTTEIHQKSNQNLTSNFLSFVKLLKLNFPHVSSCHCCPDDVTTETGLNHTHSHPWRNLKYPSGSQQVDTGAQMKQSAKTVRWWKGFVFQVSCDRAAGVGGLEQLTSVASFNQNGRTSKFHHPTLSGHVGESGRDKRRVSVKPASE